MSKFIVITSGKGGVGKTTTAVNLAAAMSALDEDVALVDINLSTPNVGLHLGAPVVPVTLNHVLARKADLVDAIYEHESGAKVIPASLSIKDLSALDEVNLTPILKDLRHVSEVVIFDSAAGLGSEATSAMAIADEVIIVTNPEMPAVTDALKTAKLAESMGKTVRGVILTRVRGSKSEMPFPNIKEMLELPILGIVPEDEAVQESLALRNAVFSTHPRSKAARSYLAIAGKLLGKEISPELGFFDKLMVGLRLRR
ncbi:MAG: cell division ATPase MinD [Candidatus Pacearchaeota archaeon]|jgi:septum site-determining protein MinD